MIIPDVFPLIDLTFEAAYLVKTWTQLHQTSPVAILVLDQKHLLITSRRETESGILLDSESWRWRLEVVN